MNQKTTFLTALVLVAGALTASVTGCELIASVDRSKLNGGGSGGTGGAGTGGMTTSSSSSSSSSGVAGMGGTAGMGGMGGMCATMACTTPADCPAAPNECVSNTCSNGCCGTTNVADGTALATQTAGNCAKEVCMGGMTTGTQVDDTDKPADMDDCHTGSCDASHMPVQTPKAKDTACTSGGGKVCGDPAGANAGKCVECNADGQCTAPQVCDPKNGSGTCVDPGCTDGAKNGTETDVDCGGSCGATCMNGSGCKADGDCQSTFCNTTTMKCASPLCTDGFKNGNETGTDCGGTTCVGQGKTCAVGVACGVDADCASGFCNTTTMKCATPACTDGVKNGTETGTDCGGATCNGQGKTCPVGQGCGTAADCTSGKCGPGLTCVLRSDGDNCSANAQCSSNVCGINGTGNCCTAACITTGACGATACTNGVGGGACVYPTASTSCGTASCTGSTLTAAGSCNGMGACSPGTPAACPNNFACAGATACGTSCSATGTAPNATSVGCASGAYCDTVPTTPVCATALKMSAAVCNNSYECTSGTCCTGAGVPNAACTMAGCL